jgi:hypothetical protein
MPGWFEVVLKCHRMTFSTTVSCGTFIYVQSSCSERVLIVNCQLK